MSLKHEPNSWPAQTQPDLGSTIAPAPLEHSATSRWLLKDEDGCLTKEKARACIDGSIFYQLAAENEQRKARHASAQHMKSAFLVAL